MNNATEIRLFPLIGEFGENKDLAREIREKQIESILQANKEVILNFQDVHTVTQSFIHALISQTIRDYGVEVLDKIGFKNCNDNVKKIISIVVEYMQISL